MSSYSWIKLYHEILHDPKMGRLPDNLWRRSIEIFLLAGETGQSGDLPDAADMAWTLRLNEDQLLTELNELSRVNIVEQRDGRWRVIHFAERQTAVPDGERKAGERQRKKARDYYASRDRHGGVTSRDTDSHGGVTSRDTDKEEDKDKEEELDLAADAPPEAGSSASPARIVTESKEMGGTLIALCQLDSRLMTDDQRGAINQTEKKLRENGVAPNQLGRSISDTGTFAEWWYTHDWRGKVQKDGKSGRAPAPHEVRQCWGAYRAWFEKRSAGTATRNLTPAQQAVLISKQREKENSNGN